MTMFENENPVMPFGAPDNGDDNTLTVGERPTNLNYNGAPYQASYNIFHENHTGWAAQCTWHCYGRAKEMKNKTISFKSGGNDAKNWWANVDNCDKSQTPRAHSIAVWSGGSRGHVAYVEGVATNYLFITEANWGDTHKDALDEKDGVVKKITPSAMQSRYAGANYGYYTLLGYIYL